MSKEYFFVARHAKAWSRERWEGTDYTRPLGKRGRQQAVNLAARLLAYEKDYPITSVTTSSSKRCVQTAQTICDALGLPMQFDDRLSDDPAVLKLVVGDPRDLIKPGALLITHGDVTEKLCNRRLVLGRHVRREIK